MFPLVNCRVRTLWGALLLLAALPAHGLALTSWNGILRDTAGNPVAGAVIRLHSPSGRLDYTSTTSGSGAFSFDRVMAGEYRVSARKDDQNWLAPKLLVINDDLALSAGLRISSLRNQLRVVAEADGSVVPRASGGENLSGKEVSSLPLNERDFSKLLLLAAGTMTDTNGSANFTQQFAVNGQRSTATVFCDGRD